ncbi:Hypothetical protein A7982_09986 [Minicystis rosea]|nr:Hypothetical protein A7982_09986 [Minicystis rosea]
MTTTRTGLPPDLIFEPDGHVSDLCVTCVADGELDLLPRAALDHLDACDACGARLGEAALLSVAASEALRDPSLAAALALDSGTVAPVVEASSEPIAAASTLAPPSPRKARRPLPIAAIAAAVFVAALTAGPALVDAVTNIPSSLAAAIGWLPTLVRLTRALLSMGPSVLGPWALAIKSVSAIVFVLAGLQVARVAMRRRAIAVEGGMQ